MAGFLADLIQDIFQSGLGKIGLIKYSLDTLAASMFIRVDHSYLITGILEKLVGFFAGAILSIILGILFVYLIELSYFRFVVVKGLLYGGVLWFIIYGGIMAALHVSYLQDYDPLHTLSQLLVHLLFGFSLGIIVAKLDRKDVKS